jgi:hypothetical protein
VFDCSFETSNHLGALLEVVSPCMNESNVLSVSHNESNVLSVSHIMRVMC